MESIIQNFWNPAFWLPPGFTWDNFKNPNDKSIRFPEATDLLYPIPGALLIIFLRLIIENYVFFPLGRNLGIKPQKPPSQNPILEKYFLSKNGVLPSRGSELKKLSQLTDLSERSIQRWFRTRNTTKRATKLTKFSECLWRGCCYVITFSFGLIVLWNKPWMWDLSEYWANHPYHDLGCDLRWYYFLGSSLYTSFALSQFYDVQRKDFWEMFIHHITTLLLMALSWMSNLTRIGSIVLLLHDCADIPLEFAKVASYSKRDGIRDILFGIFVVIWTLTRLIFFPFYLLYSINYEAQDHLQIFPMFRILANLLVILFGLHLFWTWHIIKMLIRAYRKGSSPDRDSRSSTESSQSSDDDNSQIGNSATSIVKAELKKKAKAL